MIIEKSKEELSKRSSRRVSKFRSGIGKPLSSSKGPKEDYLYRHYKNNYNKGDVFEYAHAQDIHGAANIGHIPRLVLQVTEYK